jgi:bifunctional DNase/RNase
VTGAPDPGGPEALAPDVARVDPTEAPAPSDPATTPLLDSEVPGPDAPGAPGAVDAATDAPDAPDGPVVDPDALVPVEVINVVFTLPSPGPVLQLGETEPPYRVAHFPIGLPEAQAIALGLDHEFSPRPTTSELLAAVVSAGGIELVAVRLTGLREGTVLGELDLMTSRGHAVVDCRPTDGVALALRQPVPAPILCHPSLFD